VRVARETRGPAPHKESSAACGRESVRISAGKPSLQWTKWRREASWRSAGAPPERKRYDAMRDAVMNCERVGHRPKPGRDERGGFRCGNKEKGGRLLRRGGRGSGSAGKREELGYKLR